MNRRWLCSDVWMDILPSFDHAQLGLKIALLSDRFDLLVDAHFDGKSELTIWRIISIEKDKGPKQKMSMLISDNSNFVEFSTAPIGGNFVDFPLSVRQLHNKICFKNIQIQYIDYSVIEFLRSKKRFFDRSGTDLNLNVHAIDTDVQPIWDAFIRQIWPIFAQNIRELYFPNANHLDNLRRRTSPTILTDSKQLNSIDSGDLFPDGIADFDFETPNATAGQALTKWLHTPTTDGQPKRLYRNGYIHPPNLEWVNNFKETFRRATTSVSYQIQLYFGAETMPIEQFELVNKRTNEKLTLKLSEELKYYCMYNWLLQRCPIGETATAPVKWENRENSGANFKYYIRFDLRRGNHSGASLNNISFDLWSFDKSIGPLSPPAEEEKEEKADKNNKNVV